MNIQITERDVTLLRWINRSGYVTTPLVVAYWRVDKSTAYKRLRKLVLHGYLIHEPIFHGMPGIYRVSALGVQMSGSVLPPLRAVNKGTYRHDLMVTALSLSLLKQFGGQYISERLLRHKKGQRGVGQFGHVCDGVLVLPDKHVAIEVELSKKGKRRREQIFRYYLKNFEYQAVWYFCDHAEVENQVKSFTQTFSFLSVYRLSDYLSFDARGRLQ